MNKIQDIIEQIKRLERELTIEVQKKEEEFFYKIIGKKIYFDDEIKKYHKTISTKIHTYIFNAKLLNIITAPVIWFCLLPAVFLDISASFYQAVCFPVYGIPKVKRNEYIVVDRYALSYLNPIEKINCVYCGYFNGLITYVQEIAALTEQYWCPIKHARKISSIHSRYNKFIEYGDAMDIHERIEKIRKDFNRSA